MRDNRCCSDDLKAVAVIGNGPSAIYLSYFLSGNWPVYNGHQHPNETLHYRLLNMTSKNLIEQDFEMLSSGLEGRSANHMALLFDTLTNPYADFGMDSPSLLHWKHNPGRKISHVVIGKGQPGGAWQTMEREMKSLSLSFLLQLPDMHFGDWLKSYRSSVKPELKIDETRAAVDEVCQYFQDFIETKGLSEHFLNSHIVQRVRKIPYKNYMHCTCCVRRGKSSSVDFCKTFQEELGSCVGDDGNEESQSDRFSCHTEDPDLVGLNERLLNKRDYIWEIYGTDSEGKEFCIHAINLVLATGSSDCPNKLGVKGEDLRYVLHAQTEFDRLVKKAAKTCGKRVCKMRRNCNSFFRICNLPLPQPSLFLDNPVVIVGSGLSAADAVLYALDRQISVYHVFRSDYDTVDKFYSSLSPVIYPEYVKVYNLMKEKVVLPGRYKCFPGANLLHFDNDHQVYIQECEKEEATIVQASVVVVLIGSRPDLSFLGGEVTQTLYRKSRTMKTFCTRHLDVDPISYKSKSHEGLYAMGSLVGDNFVRFLGGGALAISSDIIKSCQS